MQQGGNDKFIGNPPPTFTGARSQAEAFILQWEVYAGVNANHSAMMNKYQKAMLFLTYIQGNAVNQWVMSASRWLVNEVATGTNQFDNRLWENLLNAFQRQFGDVLSKERAQAQLDAGIHMKDGKIDDYIAQFEQLVRHAGYNINAEQTLKYFTKGLPRALYETMYQHDDPRNYEEWRESALKRQQKWIHMQTVRGNLDAFKPGRATGGALAKLLAPLQNDDRMDTSADRVRGRLAGAEDIIANHPRNTRPPQPPFPPRGGFIQRQFKRDHSQTQCYNCQKMGHISRDCRQPRRRRDTQARTSRNRANQRRKSSGMATRSSRR